MKNTAENKLKVLEKLGGIVKELEHFVDFLEIDNILHDNHYLVFAGNFGLGVEKIRELIIDYAEILKKQQQGEKK